MTKFADVDELESVVNQAKGEIVICSGGDLRDVGGESRLKALARERIAQTLRGSGLVVIPEVPDDQERLVYVAKAGSPVEKLFTAFVDPSTKRLGLIQGSVEDAGAVAGQQTAAAELRELLDEAQGLLASLEGETAPVAAA